MDREEFRNLSLTFLNSLTNTTNSLKEVIHDVAKNMKETIINQQTETGRHLDQVYKIVETNQKVMEAYQKLAEKVICLDEERDRRLGKELYAMVETQKEKIESKYVSSDSTATDGHPVVKVQTGIGIGADVIGIAN